MDWFLYDNDLRYERVKKDLFSNKLFSYVIRSNGILYTAEKIGIKYFVQDKLVKTSLFYVRTATWLAPTATNYVFLKVLFSYFHVTAKNCILF